METSMMEHIQRLLTEANVTSYEKAEKVIENYLSINPNDTDAWIKLSLIETLSPLEDYEGAIKYLRSAQDIGKDDARVLILLSFFLEWYSSGLDKELVQGLLSMKMGENREIASISCYILAWHYKKDVIRFESLLKESITLHPKHVNNYTDLGKYYISNERAVEGRNAIKIGLSNAIKIYDENSEDDQYDRINIDRFISERITGVHMSKGNYLSLQELAFN